MGSKSVDTCIIFDMDGVLIDSRFAVEESYRMSGVKMPAGSWGKSWREWLPETVGSFKKAVWVHEIKNIHYRHILPKYMKELYPATLARGLIAEGAKCELITAASREAAELVLSLLELDMYILDSAINGVPRRTRIARRSNQLHREFGIMPLYVDDDEKMCNRVAKFKNIQGAINYTPKMSNEEFELKVRTAWSA